MIDISTAYISAQDDIETIQTWCNNLYSESFQLHFEKAENLFTKLQSTNKPITDTELNWILIDLPIQLFDASETLNAVRCAAEVIKLRNKQKERELIQEAKKQKITLKKDDVAVEMLSDILLHTCYLTVIERVENQISFCKELIMGAKKVWDSRRNSEKSNPVAPIDELPEYKIKKNQYIKGGTSDE